VSSKIVAVELSIYQTRGFIDMVGGMHLATRHPWSGICVGIHVVQVQCNPGVP